MTTPIGPGERVRHSEFGPGQVVRMFCGHAIVEFFGERISVDTIPLVGEPWPVIAPASGMLAGLLGRRSPGAGSLAALDGIGGLPDELISALETRAIWAKFGF